MIRKKSAFKDLYGAIHVRYWELCLAGIDTNTKHLSGMLGDDDPLALHRAVFFNARKVFCLRGGEEQCSL